MPIGRWNVMIKKYRKRDDQMIKANFDDYKLSSELLEAISMLNFKELTKVQKEVMHLLVVII